MMASKAVRSQSVISIARSAVRRNSYRNAMTHTDTTSLSRVATVSGPSSLTRHFTASPRNFLATPTSPEVEATKRAAEHATSIPSSQRGGNTPPTPPPDMAASLDRILPKEVFHSREAGPETKSSPSPDINEPMAREIVETVLEQLRATVDAPTQKETDNLQKSANEKVLNLLQMTSIPASSLHDLATKMLKISKDPRRTPIAFRLFSIAFGIDPRSLPDPTSTGGSPPDPSLASVPIAGKDAWGINAAGYSWASMVLSGQSPPPPGIHLVKQGSQEYIQAIAAQQAAAVRIYATLAMRGDAQGMLGMGRVLVAGTQRSTPVPGKTGEESDKEVQLMLQRAIALWTKAGSMGLGDAYFELGLLYLGGDDNVKKMIEPDEERAREYFALGAEKGDARSHHALGVVYTQAAMKDNRSSPSPPERNEQLSKSFHHFTEAAQSGDAQSAHNVGLRYLLRDEMMEEVGLGKDKDGRSEEEVRKQANERHEQLWGVTPDDKEAKKWFGEAASLGSAPGMMNYAGMLVEGRGADVPMPSAGSKVESKDDALSLILDSRIVDLKVAESLYAKVAAHASVIQQSMSDAQQQGQTPDPSVAAGKEMGDFAQDAMKTVQTMIQKIAEDKGKLSKK